MPTVRRCCIVGCMSNAIQTPNLQFFQFPRPDNPFYKLWTQACQASLSLILIYKNSFVCALHFHPNCIGSRRLTSSAVPSLKLGENDRSRKRSYINAVVYEWLVRANLNPQLTGFISDEMIKEKANTAKQIITCESFTADTCWLNRFRKTHLKGFARKLTSNQLKPIGTSLWIPEIVQDLAHYFPPTSAERIDNFENVPEQYEEDDDGNEQEPAQTYQQEQNNGYGQDNNITNQSYYQQPAAQSYYKQQQHHHQQQQNGYNHYNSHPQEGMHPGYGSYHDYYNERPPHPQPHQQHSGGGYGAHPAQTQHHVEQPQGAITPQQQIGYHHYNSHPQEGMHPGYGSYHDYYNERPPHPQPHQQHSGGGYGAHPAQTQHHVEQPQGAITPQQQIGYHHYNSHPQEGMHPGYGSYHDYYNERPPHPQPHQQHSGGGYGAHPAQTQHHVEQPQQHPTIRLSSHYPPRQNALATANSSLRRRQSTEPESEIPPLKSSRSSAITANDSASNSPSRPVIKSPPITTENRFGVKSNNTNIDNSFKIKLPLANSNSGSGGVAGVSASGSGSSSANSQRSSTPNSQANNLNSRSNSPKFLTGRSTNGNTSPTPSQSANTTKELETYKQALQHLKPLEDFALLKGDFRAMSLISRLETVLKKADYKTVIKSITPE